MAKQGEGSQQSLPTFANDELQAAFLSLTEGNANPAVQQFSAQEVLRLNSEIAAKTRAYDEMCELYQGALLDVDTYKTQLNIARMSAPSSPNLFASPANDEMITDKLTTEPTRPIAPIKKRGVELLPNTKAMKTCARNLIQKLGRLRTRLVKATAVKTTNNPAKVKQYYQFRLVSEDKSEIKIFEDNRKTLDAAIAGLVIDTLIKDLDEQITLVKDQLKESGKQNDFRINGMISLNNNEWYLSELSKLRTASIPKVGAPQTSQLSSEGSEGPSSQTPHSQPEKETGRTTKGFIGFKKTEGSETASRKKSGKKSKEGKKGQKQPTQKSQGPKRPKSKGQPNKKAGQPNSNQKSTLNLGANFQIISPPSLQSRRESWKGVAKEIKEIVREDNSFTKENSFNNILEAVNFVMINNESYFNKTVASSSRFRHAVKINKLVQNVFDFLNDNELMCILADKNLGLTIIDKSWYFENMLKHFNRTDVFELCEGFDLQQLHVSAWLQSHLRKYCSIKSSLDLTLAIIDPHAQNLPQAYGLIKLHKTPYKLRIITPVVEWVNVKAAVEVVRRLGDYVKLFNHVLANSSDLVREFQGLMSYDFVLASFDVSDMYNSIGQEDCLRRIEVLAKDHGWWTDKNEPYWRQTMVLIEFVFHTSYVGFGGRVFKQKRGLPMGSPLSPVLANLYMVQLEDVCISSMRQKGIFYYRYLDDVLFFYSSLYAPMENDRAKFRMAERMAHFCKLLTTFSDDSIIFERTGEAHNPGQYVDYLDLKLEISLDNRMERNKVLRLSVYDKPTNLHIYTDPSTFYPFHYIYNWIQGENIRLIRNSSTSTAYDQSLLDFKKFLHRRAYGQDLVEKFCSLNYYGDRCELLDGAKPHKTRNNARDINQDNHRNRYITVRNNGSRPLLTSAIHVVDSFVNTLEISERRLIPVVSRGKSIVSVMNQAKKNLAGYQPQ
ncbi:unnamed protein product [Rhizophagus irregularis]|nr:unnamed protein product [Rhizophagus irregularis]